MTLPEFSCSLISGSKVGRKKLRTVLAGALAIALLLEPGLAVPVAAQSSGSDFAAAVNRTIAGKHLEAQALARNLKSPIERKLVEWLYIQSGSPDVGAERILAFLENNKHWPQRELTKRRLERAFYDKTSANAPLIRRYFANHEPVSFAGMLALARVYLAEGNRAEAAKWVGKAWRETDFSADGEKRVLSEFGGLLTQTDHRRRLVRLIYDQDTTAAMRTAALISKDHVKMVEAARALFAESKSAMNLLNAVPASLRNQPVMLYPLVRYYRRSGQEAKARQIAATVNPAPGEFDNPYAWWVEKRMLARTALTPNSPAAWQEAYRLVRSHGYAEGTGLHEGEFLAGWISLRYLNQPRQALGHFQKLRQEASSPDQVSEAEYWLGRTKLVLGDKGGAQAHFQNAAQHPYSYYGLLARDRLGIGNKPLPVGKAPEVSDRVVNQVLANNELMAAAKLLANAGQQRLVSAFFSAAASRAQTAEEAAAIATIAWRLKAPHLALRTARTVARRGIHIGGFAYPVNAVPQYKQLTKPVDPALVYGVIRQESEFNPVAASSAGARGLMQIMPGTAQLVAKKYGVAYSQSKLTDPNYSLMLGTAHLNDLIENFNGSYIMTLVAYNAGPRRVSEWNARFGDPRKGEIDPIDWIESIPFQETRDYVKKIMANVMAYRSRLAPNDMRTMTAELSRGGAVAATSSTARSSERPAANPVAAPASECNRLLSIASLISCN